MTKTLRQGYLLFLAVLMTALASCSDKKTVDLLDIAGDDAQAIIMIKPVDLLKSFDARIEDGKLVLPKALKRNLGNDFDDMLKIEGLDYELGMVAYYEHSPYYLAAMNVKDADALARSLKKMGYRKQTMAGLPVFANDDEATLFVIKENTLIVFNSWNSDRWEECVETIIDRVSTPVAAWKKDAIVKNSSNTIYGLGMSPDNRVDLSIPFFINLDGAALHAEARFYDLDGKTIDWTELTGVDFSTIGEESSLLSSKDAFAFAFGGFDENLYKVLNKLDDKGFRLPYGVKRNMDEDIMKALTGGFFGSINIVDPTSRRYDRLSAYNIVAGATTVEGKGVRLLKNIVGMLKDNGLAIKSSSEGYTFRIPDQGTVEAYATDNDIVVATEDKTPNSTMSRSALDDCYAWMSLNIPEAFAPLKQFGVKVGMKGEYKLKADVMQLDFEFVGSDKPFMATIMDIAERN
ncbi:MAG: hypothetical protein K2M00_10180 [Muribaculaceae bacterium]|nr:hypothetical protein [Muribaculaceae bacterium]